MTGTQAISAQTNLVGLFGHPVGHSLSPCIHNAAFRASRLDSVYLAFDVLPGRLIQAIESVRVLGMRGVNLTVPHKEAVMELVEALDPLAARIGAVNTIVNDAGRLTGYNTDVSGFRAALRSVLPKGAAGLRCLVFGAGGAARAVLAGLAEEDAEGVYVYNRTFERAEALCEAAAEWGSTRCEAIARDRLAEIARSVALLVNATPLGQQRSVKDFASPVDIVHSGHVVVDLVYTQHSVTPWVAAARACGALATDGMEMLVMQAAGSYGLWTGLRPPLDVMRESVGCG